MKADATELVRALRVAADDPHCPFKGVRIEVQDREDGSAVVSAVWGKAEGWEGEAVAWAAVVKAGAVASPEEAHRAVRSMIKGILVATLIGGPGRLKEARKGGERGEGQG